MVGIDRAQVRISGDDFQLSPIDICQANQVNELVQGLKPDEIYHLAAFHHSSQDDFSDSAAVLESSYQVHVLSLFTFLEAVRVYSPGTKLFYAASSHIFGHPASTPQDELTPINPISLYGITKAAGLFLCRKYRSQHNLFASAGILYNHESPLRAEKFVSQKIIQGVLRIQQQLSDQLALGDLGAEADWGFAPDYVSAMHRILQNPNADDFIVATGIRHSVADFVKEAFSQAGLDWEKYVRQQKGLLNRQTGALIGNPAKLSNATGWRPSVSFSEMISIMLQQGSPH